LSKKFELLFSLIGFFSGLAVLWVGAYYVGKTGVGGANGWASVPTFITVCALWGLAFMVIVNSKDAG